MNEKERKMTEWAIDTISKADMIIDERHNPSMPGLYRRGSTVIEKDGKRVIADIYNAPCDGNGDCLHLRLFGW